MSYSTTRLSLSMVLGFLALCRAPQACADTVTNAWRQESPQQKLVHATELIKGIDLQGSNIAQAASAGVKLLQEVVSETEGSVSNLDARADALHWLGYCHYVGMGVPKDQAKAAELFAKAGEKGKCWAVTDLAMCYALGTGVPQDKAKAVALFERAVREGLSAEEGTSDEFYIEMFQQLGHGSGIGYVARDNLALCYMTGFGCETNMAKAAQLLNIPERKFKTPEQRLLVAYYLTKTGDKEAAGKVLSEGIDSLAEISTIDEKFNWGSGVWIKRLVVPCDELLSEMAAAGVAGAGEQLCLRLFAGNFIDRDVNRALSVFRVLPKGESRMAALVGLLNISSEAYQEDSAAIVALCEQMADEGDGEIAYWLGRIYIKGRWQIQANAAKSVLYMEKAALAGVADAQYALGLYYFLGRCGVRKNVVLAVQLWEKAAANGSTEALVAVGQAYAEGNGVPMDLEKGIAYMRRGAEAGDAAAQLTLGGCYAYGDYGVKVDTAEGFKWFSMAYSNGNQQAYIHLSNAYAYGLGVKRNVFKAIHFALTAATIGDERGNAIFAAIKPVDESPESIGAADLAKIRADAEKGDARSQYFLARAYYYGMGLEQDYEKAVSWAGKSAAQNYPDAANLLSVYYSEKGAGAENVRKAREWREKAVALGSLKAMYNMSLNCHEGTIMPRNDVLANHLARAAAACGYAPAQLLYGRYLAEGVGVSPNLKLAKIWIRKAAENGLKAAQDIMRDIDNVAN